MKKDIEKLKARIDELVRIADVEYERRVKAEAGIKSINQAFMGVDGGSLAIDDLVSCIEVLITKSQDLKAELARRDELKPFVYHYHSDIQQNIFRFGVDAANRAREMGFDVTPLFTAAPAPAVPDKIRALLDETRQGRPMRVDESVGYQWGWNECIDAMLKGGAE